MKEALHFAIVGCGMISSFHAAAIADTEGAELIGACSRSRPGAERFAEEHGIRAYENFQTVLEDDEVDAVSICTPSGNHAAQVLAALEHGKHVVVEKPMCLTLEDADKIVFSAEKHGLTVCSIAQLRYADASVALKNAIDNGEFGRLLSASLSMSYFRPQSYYDQAQWRGTVGGDGGGVLMNQGIHGIDMLCYLMGQPKEVSGFTATLMRNIEVEDTAAAIIRFENGAIADVNATVCASPSCSKRITIRGEKGTVVMVEDGIESWDLPTKCPVPIGERAGFAAAADPKKISHVYHAREYADFVKAVNTNDNVLIDAREGRLPLEVILGIYRSSREGIRVPIRNKNAD